MSTRIWLARAGRAGWQCTGAIVGACAAVLAVAFLLPLLMPLMVTVIGAATLWPLVERLRDRGLPPSAAALAGLLALPLVLLALAVPFGHVLVGQLREWEQVLAAARQQLHDALGDDPLPAISIEDWRTAIQGVGAALSNAAIALAQFAVGLLASAYVLFYLLRDGPRCTAWLERILPLRPGLLRVMISSAALQFRRYVLGTTVIAALDAVVITAGAIALDLPLVATIAILTFFAAFVPYVGAWISAVYAVVVALGAGGVTAGLWMLGIVLVTQNLLEGLLRPYVFGRALGLHPIIVLAATVAGAALAGVSGVFIAPPVAAIAASWWSASRRPHPGPDHPAAGTAAHDTGQAGGPPQAAPAGDSS
jgi:predicted PurR-regulated permease PerM